MKRQVSILAISTFINKSKRTMNMILKARFKGLISDDVQRHPLHLVTTRVWQCLSWVFVWSSMSLLLAASLLSVAVLCVVFYDIELLYDGLFKAAQPLFNEHFQKEYVVFPFWIMYLQVVTFLGLLLSQKSRLWREILPRIFELRYAFFSRLIFGCFIVTCIGAEFRILEILDAAFVFSMNSAIDFAAAQSANFMFSDFSELPGGGMFLVVLVVKLLQLVLLLTLHKRYGTLLLMLCAPGLRFVFNGAPIVFPLFPFGEADGYALESAFGGKKITPGSKSNSVVNQTTRSFCVGSNKNVCWKVAKDAVKELNFRDLQEFNKAHAAKGFSKNAAVDALGHGRNLVEKSKLSERIHQYTAKPDLTYDQFNLEHNSNKLDLSPLSPEEQVVAIILYGNLARVQSLTISSSPDVPLGNNYPDYAREQVYNRETSRSPAAIINHVGNIANAQDEYIASQNILRAYPFLGGYSLNLPEPGVKADLIVTQEDKAPLYLDFKSKQGILTKENHTYYVDRISNEILKVTAPNIARGGARVGVITQYTTYDPAFAPERLRVLVVGCIEKQRAQDGCLLEKRYAKLEELTRGGNQEAAVVVELEIRTLESRVAAAKTALNDPEVLGFINRVDVPIIDAYQKPLPYEKLVELGDWAEKDAKVSYNKRIGKDKLI